MNQKATAVLKLGGSLLEPPDLADLPARLSRVLLDHGGARPIFIVGGGPMVECIRRWDRLYHLEEEPAHWIAVRALSINARVVEKLLPVFRMAEAAEACFEAWEGGRVPILDCHAFLLQVDERRPDPLPRSWKITTDSIAARAAQHFAAPRLVLLKSVALFAPTAVAEAVERGLVDPHFDRVIEGIEQILFLNLRGRLDEAVELIP
ncbi:MAG: hypothetical protein HY717_11625 [Planctomycetes bacterium]|nr:hypothetical protein [Planctomycetota bacterium]